MSSGNTLLIITPTLAEFPLTAFAIPGVRGNNKTINFSDAADSSVEFPAYLPDFYAGGGLTITIGYMAATATTGTVAWDASIKALPDGSGDVDTKAFATAIQVVSTTDAVSGVIKYQDIVLTSGAQMDSLLKEQYFRIQILRDISAGTLVGNAELVFISIKET